MSDTDSEILVSKLGPHVPSDDDEDFTDSGEERSPVFRKGNYSDSFSTSSGDLSESDDVEFSESESERAPSRGSRRSMRHQSSFDTSLSFDASFSRSTQDMLRFLRGWKPTGAVPCGKFSPPPSPQQQQQETPPAGAQQIDWSQRQPAPLSALSSGRVRRSHTATAAVAAAVSGGSTSTGHSLSPRDFAATEQQQQQQQKLRQQRKVDSALSPRPSSTAAVIAGSKRTARKAATEAAEAESHSQQQQQQQGQGQDDAHFRVLARTQFETLVRHTDKMAAAKQITPPAVSEQQHATTWHDAATVRKHATDADSPGEHVAPLRNDSNVLRRVYMNALPESTAVLRERKRRARVDAVTPARVPRVTVTHRTVTLTNADAHSSSSAAAATAAGHKRHGSVTARGRPASAAVVASISPARPAARSSTPRHETAAAAAATTPRPRSASALLAQHAATAAAGSGGMDENIGAERPVWRPSGAYKPPVSAREYIPAGTDGVTEEHPYRHMTVHEILRQARRDERRRRRRGLREQKHTDADALTAAIRKARRTVQAADEVLAGGSTPPRTKKRSGAHKKKRKTQQWSDPLPVSNPEGSAASDADPAYPIESAPPYEGGGPQQIDVFEVLAREAEKSHLLGKIPTLYPGGYSLAKIPTAGVGSLAGEVALMRLGDSATVRGPLSRVATGISGASTVTAYDLNAFNAPSAAAAAAAASSAATLLQRAGAGGGLSGLLSERRPGSGARIQF